MKTLKKSLKWAVLNSLFVVLAIGVTSCSEEEGEKDLTKAGLLKERVAFKDIKLGQVKVYPNTKNFLAYYNGYYCFQKIFKTDTINYFIVNPTIIGKYKEDSTYTFTANIYNTTDVLLQNNYNGKQHYYELDIQVMDTNIALFDGSTFNPVTMQGGGTAADNPGGNTSGEGGSSSGGGTTGGGGTNPGGTGGGTGGGGLNPGGGGLNPGGGGLNPGGGGTKPFGK